jgi:hypothetical protein
VDTIDEPPKDDSTEAGTETDEEGRAHENHRLGWLIEI